MALQPNLLPTGTVVGRYAFVSSDAGNDADKDPSMTPVIGFVKFICTASPLPVQYDNGTEIMSVVPLQFIATFDENGYISSDGSPGIELPATDSLAYNPSSFTWRVEFDLRDKTTNHTILIPSFHISVPTDGTVNLPAVTPVASANGVAVIKGDQGASVTGAIDNGDGTMTFTLSDGSTAGPVSAVVGPQGVEGDSAYEVAVTNGFVGTQPEWLDSLKGLDGVNAVENDTAIAGYVNNTASQTRAALDDVYGETDTGWVDLSGQLLNGWTSNTGAVGCAIRRQGKTVYFRIRSLNGGSATNTQIVVVDAEFIPPSADGGVAMFSGGIVRSLSCYTDGSVRCATGAGIGEPMNVTWLLE